MIRNLAVFLAFCAAAAGIYGYSEWQVATGRAQEAEATAAGFSTYDSMQRAKVAGVSDPARWADQEALRKKQEAEERDRKLAEKMKRDEAEHERTRNPATKMNVKSMSWSKSGFGSVALVTLTIENKNDFPVKDISVACDFNANSGTHLNTSSGTIFETIKPNSSRTFREFNIGFIHSQAQRSGCRVDTARRL